MSSVDEVVLDLSDYALGQTEQSLVKNRITDDVIDMRSTNQLDKSRW